MDATGKPGRSPDSPETGRQIVLRALRKWDPIGVISESNQDEYDLYAPRIEKLLIAKSNIRRLAEELYNIRTRLMGLTGDREKTQEMEIAATLIDDWNAREP